MKHQGVTLGEQCTKHSQENKNKFQFFKNSALRTISKVNKWTSVKKVQDTHYKQANNPEISSNHMFEKLVREHRTHSPNICSKNL